MVSLLFCLFRPCSHDPMASSLLVGIPLSPKVQTITLHMNLAREQPKKR
uniref:Uncharacterized protein n=1 Tax=Arundo donax TaxID=35708 RepID=A0A0A9C1R1_ARUDO